MKNLPEKIYLNLNMTPQEVVETKDKDFHEATKTWEITWSEECLSEHDPEYVRKDVLIEKAAWTEEDERIYKSIIYSFAHNYPLTIQQQEFVKSIRPQNTWKPSDEQMRALHYLNLTGNIFYAGQGQTLIELYNDLKKLAEE